jgi:hypothetical protein
MSEKQPEIIELVEKRKMYTQGWNDGIGNTTKITSITVNDQPIEYFDEYIKGYKAATLYLKSKE